MYCEEDLTMGSVLSKKVMKRLFLDLELGIIDLILVIGVVVVQVPFSAVGIVVLYISSVCVSLFLSLSE